jgi:hypothetical protein
MAPDTTLTNTLTSTTLASPTSTPSISTSTSTAPLTNTTPFTAPLTNTPLSPELQKIHDDLNTTALMFYNSLDPSSKVIYLTTLADDRKKYRKKGV